jgi:hypothetical protein
VDFGQNMKAAIPATAKTDPPMTYRRMCDRDVVSSIAGGMGVEGSAPGTVVDASGS